MSKLTKEIYSDLTDRLIASSKEIGQANDKIECLERALKEKEELIGQVESQNRALLYFQESLLTVSSTLGIDLSPLKKAENRVWDDRVLMLITPFVRRAIEAVKIPSFDEAKSMKEMQDFLESMPGYSNEEYHVETEKHYVYIEMGARQFLPHLKKHKAS